MWLEISAEKEVSSARASMQGTLDVLLSKQHANKQSDIKILFTVYT